MRSSKSSTIFNKYDPCKHCWGEANKRAAETSSVQYCRVKQSRTIASLLKTDELVIGSGDKKMQSRILWAGILPGIIISWNSLSGLGFKVMDYINTYIHTLCASAFQKFRQRGTASISEPWPKDVWKSLQSTKTFKSQELFCPYDTSVFSYALLQYTSS